MAKVTVKVVADFITVRSVRFAGCGHVSFLSDALIKERRRDHDYFYCSTCGKHNYYPGESDLEAVERRLNTMKDQRDTVRKNLNLQWEKTQKFKRKLTAHKGHTTRLKNRIAAGVCPCCHRNFVNLGRHMSRKHPNYTLNENRHKQ